MSKMTTLCAFVIVAGFASLAVAQTPAPAAPSGKPPWVVACEGDMKKHCEAEMKANGDVRPCLAKNEATLSEGCQKTFLRQYKILELCKDDIAKHCAGAEGPAIKTCFQEKIEMMSEKCRGALTKGAKAHDKAQAAAAKADPAAGEKPVAKKKAKKEAATP